MPGKNVGENISLPEHKFVQITYHGELWKVNEIVFNLLRHLLTLGLRVRSFIDANKQQQAIKIR